MKSQRSLTVGALLGAVFLAVPTAGFAQGSLTPPGAPAPTMKTLAQIEPRTPISSLPFAITTSGSYYVTTNLTGVSGFDGIVISANNVTLDLNGFALKGVPATGTGIASLSSITNVTVRNGAVSGGWTYGVYLGGYGSLSQNLVLEQLSVSGNSYGIYSANSVIRNCQSSDNTGDGIHVYACTVSGCLVQNNGTAGIVLDAPGCLVVGNRCIGNNYLTNAYAAGIFVNDSNNRIEDNHVNGGISGIVVSASYTNNVVVKNTVLGVAGFPFYILGTQIIGPIINSTAAGVITNSNPWANFAF